MRLAQRHRACRRGTGRTPARGMTPAGRRHPTPPDLQHQGYDGTDTTTYSDDRRRAELLRCGAGGHESGALANYHPHVGQAEGLSPPFVRHPHDDGGVGRELVNTERGREGKDHQGDGETGVEGREDQAGCRKTSLTVTASNREAIKLYEDVGFTTVRKFFAYV